MKSLSKASCLDYEIYGGIPIPNRTITNIAKYSYANSWHNCTKLIQDIAGGLIVTMPSEKDLKHPKIGKYVARYLKGVDDVAVEDRIRVLRLIENLTTGLGAACYLAESMHGAGSPMAQRIMIGRQSNIERMKSSAKRLCGIES